MKSLAEFLTLDKETGEIKGTSDKTRELDENPPKDNGILKRENENQISKHEKGNEHE